METCTIKKPTNA